MKKTEDMENKNSILTNILKIWPKQILAFFLFFFFWQNERRKKNIDELKRPQKVQKFMHYIHYLHLYTNAYIL